MVRRRDPAPPAPSLAREASARGRAGRARGAGAVPRGVAAGLAGLEGASWHRRRAHGHRPARRLRPSCVCAGVSGAAVARARLRAVVPRRADQLRRGRLGRPRRAARVRRLGLAPPGRPGAAHPAGPRAIRTLRTARGRARGAVTGRSVVLPPARRRRPGHRRPRPLGRPLGPRLGRPGRQRHAGPAPGAHPVRHPLPPQPPAATTHQDHSRGPAPDAHPHRSAGDGRDAGPCFRSSTPTPRGVPTPPPRRSSTATAW